MTTKVVGVPSMTVVELERMMLGVKKVWVIVEAGIVSSVGPAAPTTGTPNPPPRSV